MTHKPQPESAPNVVPDHSTSKLEDESDAKQIVGSWFPKVMLYDGKDVSAGPGMKVVFSGENMQLGGLDCWYHLDTTQSPQHFDFGMIGSSIPNRGIYRLDGDKLEICYASSTKGLRPEKFESTPGDRNQFLICTRIKSKADGSTGKIGDASLAQSVAEAIELLHANKTESFLERFIRPDELNALKQSGWEAAVARTSLNRETMERTFRAMQSISPKMNDDKSSAIFDLTKVHIEGGLSVSNIEFIKVDGKWCLMNK